MTQKTIEQKPSPVAAGSQMTHTANETSPGQTAADADCEDDQEWDTAFAASQETLERLATRARAHRKIGRTKRISP